MKYTCRQLAKHPHILGTLSRRHTNSWAAVMGVDPSPEVEKLGSKDQIIDLVETNKTQFESPSNSTPSSENLQNTQVITGHLTEEELLCIQKFISLSKSGKIQGIPGIGNESPHVNPPTNKNSANSLFPIKRSDEAILARIAPELPESHLHFQPIFSEIRRSLSTGDYSPGEGAPSGKNLAKSDGQIAGTEVSNLVAGALVTENCQIQCQNAQVKKAHLSIIKALSESSPINSNSKIRI